VSERAPIGVQRAATVSNSIGTTTGLRSPHRSTSSRAYLASLS